MEDYVLQYLLDFQADGVFEQSIMELAMGKSCTCPEKKFRTSQLLEAKSGYLPETASPKEKDAVPPQFFVNTAKCKIPYVDPFEPNAMACSIQSTLSLVPTKVPWLPLSMTSAKSDMCCSSTKH